MSNDFKTAMEAAGLKPDRAKIGVTVINEHAIAVLHGVLTKSITCELSIAREGNSATIKFCDVEGRLMPHCVVLDRRGTWHVRTHVEI